MNKDIFQLQLGIQTYNWGKKGLDSEVCKYLMSSGQVDVESIDPNLSFAELWVGTHTKTPSLLKDGTSLDQYIKDHPEVLGMEIVKRFGNNLPFLLKVLSIGHPLQLQIHPTKDEAKVLHKKNPSAFLDDNHKPEMAVALTPFIAMCGFREPSEILKLAQDIEELAEALGPDVIEVLESQADKKVKIKMCYEEIFKKQRNFSALQEKLLNRFQDDQELYLNCLGDIFEILYKAFPGDAGCFGLYLLNVYKLSPGEAIWVPAGEIHAYVSGDCVEVLSCGDNVLFCGLVHPEDVSHFPPELTDPEILAEIVNFTPNLDAKVSVTKDSDGNDCLEPPVDEFRLIQIKMFLYSHCKYCIHSLWIWHYFHRDRICCGLSSWSSILCSCWPGI
eukprot:GFUD01083578.1.p1 GENE.GFUD01083578.1~~GFUD01083578.1.p1  ORF type:complete len:388 (-),score=78.03 GFUD01083578.1:104-1267(-)